MLNLLAVSTPAEDIIAAQTPILIGCVAIGWLSVLLMQVIVLGQAVKVFKTRNTASISVWTYVIFFISSLIGALWSYLYYTKQICSNIGVFWGWDKETGIGYFYPEVLKALLTLGQLSIVPLIFYNVFNIFGAIWMIWIKQNHTKLAKKMHCSEIQLAKILLKKQKKELVASKYKLHKRKYFGLVVGLAAIYTFAALVSVLTCLFFVKTEDTQFFNFKGQFFWDKGIMIISIITSCATEGFGWPTFVSVLKKRDTSSMSTTWAVFTPITLTVSFIYALVLAVAEVSVGGWSAFPPDTIGALVFNGLIVNYGTLLIKLRNKRTAKKLHMDEIEYTEKILVPEYERKIKARLEVERLIKEQEQKILKRQGNLDKLKRKNERWENYQEKRLQEEQELLQKMKSKGEMKKKQDEIFKASKPKKRRKRRRK